MSRQPFAAPLRPDYSARLSGRQIFIRSGTAACMAAVAGPQNEPEHIAAAEWGSKVAAFYQGCELA
jgi:hypothetical protein